MLSATVFLPLRFQWSDIRTYLFVFLFAAGNLVLPQLCHLIPAGGQMFLPVYFFTLIAAYKFGLKVGLLTALCSPILNTVLFGMPPLAVLPFILIKSTLLAVFAGYVAKTYHKLSVLYLVAVVACYQVIGSLIEWGISQSFTEAIADLSKGIPGILIQVIGGWALLKTMAKYERS